MLVTLQQMPHAVESLSSVVRQDLECRHNWGIGGWCAKVGDHRPAPVSRCCDWDDGQTGHNSRVSGHSDLYSSRIELEVILSFWKSYRGIDPLRRTMSNCERHTGGIKACLASTQLPQIHKPLLLTLP